MTALRGDLLKRISVARCPFCGISESSTSIIIFRESIRNTEAMSTVRPERILHMPFTIADAMPRKKYGETSFGERLQAIRKARGLTQVQLAEAAATTQRAVSYYETEAGFPPAPAVIALANALKVTTDELLGVKRLRVERVNDDSEARRQWKRFQMISTLPERDQKAVVRLVNSLVAAGASRKNGSLGERNA